MTALAWVCVGLGAWALISIVIMLVACKRAPLRDDYD